MIQDFEDSFIDFDNDGCCGNPIHSGPNGRGCDPCPPVRKLTFEEWFNDRCGGDTYTQQEDIKSRMQWAWQAAQENK